MAIKRPRPKQGSSGGGEITVTNPSTVLKEDGDLVLLENGDAILLESSD